MTILDVMQVFSYSGPCPECKEPLQFLKAASDRGLESCGFHCECGFRMSFTRSPDPSLFSNWPKESQELMKYRRKV